MMWQYLAAKRLRWWMRLPMRALLLVTYLTEWVYKFEDWYEWRIVNRAIIWSANHQGYPEGFEYGMKETLNEENSRPKSDKTGEE